MIDVSRLDPDKDYFAKTTHGDIVRVRLRGDRFAILSGPYHGIMFFDFVAEVRGPIDFESLPLITKSSDQ